MGREIRRVPVGWEHPKTQRINPRTGGIVEECHPMFDRDVESAMAEWQEGYDEWKAGALAKEIAENPELPYSVNEPYRAFCDWNGQPPDPAYYRPRWPEGVELGYAVYETVTEGTPVTPTFKTKPELAEYLATTGTYWDDAPWSRAAAEAFVECEWAPSMILNTGTGEIATPKDEAMYANLK